MDHRCLEVFCLELEFSQRCFASGEREELGSGSQDPWLFEQETDCSTWSILAGERERER